MTWAFSENAKRIRKLVYEQFLAKGTSDGTGPLLKASGLTPEALEAAFEELQRGLMVMCVPGTHDVAKCPPWSNIPTRHAVERDGRHLCYAGCALEAMNIAYCYPGEAITVRSSCPQSGVEIELRLKGNEVMHVSPGSAVGHVGVDPARWADNWFHACANNNFFVSPEAVQAWEQAHPEHRGVTLSMEQLARFARYENRLDYERGADPDDGSRSCATMFGSFGVDLPAHWR